MDYPALVMDGVQYAMQSGCPDLFFPGKKTPDDFSLAIDLSFIPVDNVFLDLLRSAMLRATLRLVSQHTGQSAPHSFSESGGYLAAMQTDLKIGHRCRHIPTENKGYSLHASDEKTKSCKSQVIVASESVGKITFLYTTGMSKKGCHHHWFHMLRSRYISYVP